MSNHPNHRDFEFFKLWIASINSQIVTGLPQISFSVLLIGLICNEFKKASADTGE